MSRTGIITYPNRYGSAPACRTQFKFLDYISDPLSGQIAYLNSRALGPGALARRATHAIARAGRMEVGGKPLPVRREQIVRLVVRPKKHCESGCDQSSFPHNCLPGASLCAHFAATAELLCKFARTKKFSAALSLNYSVQMAWAVRPWRPGRARSQQCVSTPASVAAIQQGSGAASLLTVDHDCAVSILFDLPQRQQLPHLPAPSG